MTRSIQWINDPDALREMVARFRTEPCVAMDTEFVWERTYYPRLGLIQLGAADGTCYLVDAVALSDMTPLGELLADAGIVKILHDAPQDLMILRRATGASARNLFDTRLAAGFAGCAATLSLGNLLAELLDVHLAKAHTRANWIARPLAPEVLDYAADDVVHLPRVAGLLRERAQAAGVETWMDEELAALDQEGALDVVRDDEAYLRIRGAASLSRRSLAVLRELAAWREQAARQSDRPRRWVLEDGALGSIATVMPRTREALHRALRLSADKEFPQADEWLAAVERGLAIPDEQLPEPVFPVPRDSTFRKALDAAMADMQARAGRHGIDPQVVCSRNEMAQWLQAGSPASSPAHRLSRGWRAELLKEPTAGKNPIGTAG